MKGIRQSVKEYIITCPKCQMFKTENQAPKGLRQAIPIPTAKWEQITTNLVTDLPESHGFTAVAVFIDRLMKFVVFVPCRKELDAVGYARLFSTMFSKLLVYLVQLSVTETPSV